MTRGSRALDSVLLELYEANRQQRRIFSVRDQAGRQLTWALYHTWHRNGTKMGKHVLLLLIVNSVLGALVESRLLIARGKQRNVGVVVYPFGLPHTTYQSCLSCTRTQ